MASMSELLSQTGATNLGPRIGDVERNACVDRLTQEMVAGRLSEDEFDLRVERALRAQTRPDLDELTTDLSDEEPTAPVSRRAAEPVIMLSRRDIAAASAFTAAVGLLTFLIGTRAASDFSGVSVELWLALWLFGEVCGLASALLARSGRRDQSS